MRTTLIALLSLAAAAAAYAQWEPPGAPQLADDGGEPRVYFVHSYDHQRPNVAGLNERVSVHIQNFSALLKQANGNCANIVLFINGMPIKGMQPESCDRRIGHVRYLLHRTDDSNDTWHKLLGSPRHYAKPVSVSVGSDTQFAIRSDVGDFELEAVPRFWFLLFIAVAAVFVAAVIILCRRTTVIRSGGVGLSPRQRPYALSLFQMMFWFTLVVVAYVFVWMINAELDTITTSVLALIGIGAATAFGATYIDQSKGSERQIAPSRGFLNDLLNDANGVSLHRFQMFVWTIVLGVIFVASVYNNLSMPEFSATLLGLMGISSGTYVGFKAQEKTAPAAAPATTDQPATTSSSSTISPSE